MKTYTTSQSALKGFSLIELMVVIAIVGILASIAVPSYTGYIRKSKRSNAITSLLKAQSSFEGQYTTNNPPSFPTDTTTPTAATIMSAYNDSNYTYTAVSTATTYTLTATATAQGSQAKDKEGGVSCTPLKIDNTNTQSPSNCWR